MSVDPLAHETLEPYVFTGNNPVMFIDPDGKEVDPSEPRGIFKGWIYLWNSINGRTKRNNSIKSQSSESNTLSSFIDGYWGMLETVDVTAPQKHDEQLYKTVDNEGITERGGFKVGLSNRFSDITLKGFVARNGVTNDLAEFSLEGLSLTIGSNLIYENDKRQLKK